jgi:hypothetical protein
MYGLRLRRSALVCELWLLAGCVSGSIGVPLAAVRGVETHSNGNPHKLIDRFPPFRKECGKGGAPIGLCVV